MTIMIINLLEPIASDGVQAKTLHISEDERMFRYILFYIITSYSMSKVSLRIRDVLCFIAEAMKKNYDMNFLRAIKILETLKTQLEIPVYDSCP